MRKITLIGCTLGLLLGTQAHADEAALGPTLGKIARAKASPWAIAMLQYRSLMWATTRDNPWATR